MSLPIAIDHIIEDFIRSEEIKTKLRVEMETEIQRSYDEGYDDAKKDILLYLKTA